MIHAWFRLRMGWSPISLRVSTAADRAAADVRGAPAGAGGRASALRLTGSGVEGNAPNEQGHIVRIKRQLEPQLLFGRGPGGGASLREAASPGALLPFLLLAGRGGSVSRRDHNQLARKRAQLAWARTSKREDQSIPSHSSGGGPGEGLLLEKPPPPERSYRSSCWQVAAALSAAVTITNSQRERAQLTGAYSSDKASTRTPATLREGARGRGFS